MRTIDFNGVKVHVEDEELAKRLAEPEPQQVDEQEAEVLLKELEEWLAAGRSQVLNKAQRHLDALSKQFIGDSTPPVPRVGGVTGPSVNASSGVVTVPNTPSWLVGVPQAQTAAQQIAVGSVVEAVATQLSTVLENFAAQLADWVSTVAQKLFDTITDVASKMAEAHERLGEQMAEVAERLEEVAERLPSETSPPVEELEFPLGEGPEMPPKEPEPAELPPESEGETPALEGHTGGGGEEAQPAGLEEGVRALSSPASPQEVSGTPDVGALFSPQFLAAFARHLSQMTKEIIASQTRKTQSQTATPVKPQSAFDIAEQFAAYMRKGFAKPVPDPDLTDPIKTASPPERGESVADQIRGSEKASEVKKHLNEAKKEAGEK